MEKHNETIKPVRDSISCPKCGEEITGYFAKDFGNEKATLVCEHLGGKRCTKEVDLFDAHQFETRAKVKFEYGRRW